MAGGSSSSSNRKMKKQLWRTRPKALRRLIVSIVDESSDEDDKETEYTQFLDDAIKAIQSLKVLKPETAIPVPKEYRCPISNELMVDPVIISTGVTYDRANIQNILNAGTRTCPATGNVIQHDALMPNKWLRDGISEWCSYQGIEYDLSKHDDHETMTSYLNSLTSSLASEREDAAINLYTMSMISEDAKSFLGQSKRFIGLLISPLMPNDDYGIDVDENLNLQDDLTSTIRHLSSFEPNRPIIAGTPGVISTLKHLFASASRKTRTNVVDVIGELAKDESNAILFYDFNVVGSLLDLLERESDDTRVMEVAMKAIHNLFYFKTSKDRAAEDEFVLPKFFAKLQQRLHLNHLLVILGMLLESQRAVGKLTGLGVLPLLNNLMLEAGDDMKLKETSLSCIDAICVQSRNREQILRLKEAEAFSNAISELEEIGTDDGKRKAKRVIRLLDSIEQQV